MTNLDFISSDFLLYYGDITFSKSTSLNKNRSSRPHTARRKNSAGNWSYFCDSKKVVADFEDWLRVTEVIFDVKGFIFHVVWNLRRNW